MEDSGPAVRTYSSVLLCLCCCLWFDQCHFASELHGLAAHPTAPEFITVGDDRLLRIWNIRDRKVSRVGREGRRGEAVMQSASSGARRPCSRGDGRVRVSGV